MVINFNLKAFIAVIILKATSIIVVIKLIAITELMVIVKQ
jgi:hypothetical protein